MNQLFILTYNVFWKTLEGVGKKYYCRNNPRNSPRNIPRNNPNDNKNCVKNLAKVIISFSKKIARDNGIISEAVLDFVGLQEIKGYLDIQGINLLNQIKLLYPDFDQYYGVDYSENPDISSDPELKDAKNTALLTIYNRTKYINIKKIYVNLKGINKIKGSEDCRLCMINIFKIIENDQYIIFANCHFPHNKQIINIVKISKVLNELKNIYLNSHVIIVGDFNQNPTKTNINKLMSKSNYTFVDNTNLQQYNNLKTCCENNNYDKWYDQIYVSNNLAKQVKYVLGNITPFNIDNKNYSSDHKPLFCITN